MVCMHRVPVKWRFKISTKRRPGIKKITTCETVVNWKIIKPFQMPIPYGAPYIQTVDYINKMNVPHAYTIIFVEVTKAAFSKLLAA